MREFPAHGAGGGAACAPRHPKGGILFPKRIPPLNPPEKGEGSTPRPPTLAVSISKSCSACGIGCGVHGFAMNPCNSIPLATAPYYREARVTLPRRQTACRMRHCFARRIDECPVRRRLGCTATRLAERQRIIGAEANRIAEPLAASAAMPPRRHPIRQALQLFELLACNGNPFLLGVKGGYSLSEEREYPP